VALEDRSIQLSFARICVDCQGISHGFASQPHVTALFALAEASMEEISKFSIHRAKARLPRPRPAKNVSSQIVNGNF